MQEAQQVGVRPLLALTGDPLEAPPRFERDVGYAGRRRYVSFHVTARLDPVVEDGESVQLGHRSPVAVWSGHLSVWPALAGVGVNWEGSKARGDPEHHIVLDRSTRRLYAGLRADVQALLRESVPVGALWSIPGQSIFDWSSPVELGHAADCEQEALVPLLDWLGTRPLPCPSCLTVHAAGDFRAGEAMTVGEERGHPGDASPTCPSCGEPFYGRPLLALLANLVPRDGAPSLLVSVGSAIA